MGDVERVETTTGDCAESLQRFEATTVAPAKLPDSLLLRDFGRKTNWFGDLDKLEESLYRSDQLKRRTTNQDSLC